MSVGMSQPEFEYQPAVPPTEAVVAPTTGPTVESTNTVELEELLSGDEDADDEEDDEDEDDEDEEDDEEDEEDEEEAA